MLLGLDPVGVGFVRSLARPGGNVTGFSSYLPELVSKRLQSLKEIAPSVSRVAVLWDPNVPGIARLLSELQSVAHGVSVVLLFFDVRTPNEFDGAFAEMVRKGSHAVLSLGSGMHYNHRAKIAELALKHHLPSDCFLREYAESGCLMSFAPSFSDLWRRSAIYVDKILKGAKPADLPVQQPTKFEFVINLKTAKALALTIPQPLLVRADEIIQ
jgi:putative ABC transport system substrate-binding protein